MTQGLFENLEGEGRPLDLDDYFSQPEDLRMAFSILKSAHCVPVEVDLLNEISRLERTIAETTDPAARQTLWAALTTRQVQLRMMIERRSRHRWPGAPPR